MALNEVMRKYKGAGHGKSRDVVLEYGTACAKALWQEICNELSRGWVGPRRRWCRCRTGGRGVRGRFLHGCWLVMGRGALQGHY